MSEEGYATLVEAMNPHVSRTREVMAGVALVVSIFGFVLQTEVLGSSIGQSYKKPMFVMYITHSCYVFLMPMQILGVWLSRRVSRKETLHAFYQRHMAHLRHTAVQVAKLNGFTAADSRRYYRNAVAWLAVAMNAAGASWYIAVNMTTTADLTAIFNCSSFFAYGLSVLILGEVFSLAKASSVALSIVGVIIIAYFGSGDAGNDPQGRRSMGNLIIAFGTVLYGLYEVLYKKIACPPQAVSARKQAAFANLTGAGIGLATLLLMWPLLIILHVTGIETFELPSWEVTKYLGLSIFGNVIFSGAFLIVMSLTSPVMGSVTSLLATCMVPFVDFVIWHKKISFAEFVGGTIIIIAFGLMAWASTSDFIENESDDEL